MTWLLLLVIIGVFLSSECIDDWWSLEGRKYRTEVPREEIIKKENDNR